MYISLLFIWLFIRDWWFLTVLGPACSLCPVNWKWIGGDTCFYISEKEATWLESKDFCFSQNSTLLTLKRKSKLVRFLSYWYFFAMVSTIENSSPVSKYLLKIYINRHTVPRVWGNVDWRAFNHKSILMRKLVTWDVIQTVIGCKRPESWES